MFSTDRRGWLSQKNFVDEDGAFDCEVQSVNTLVSVVETVDDKLCGLERIIDAKQCSFLKLYSWLLVLLYVVCFGKGMKDSFFKGTDCYKKN